MRYIKWNDPQLAYTLHILNNTHKYEPIDNIVTKCPLMISFE
jgi:hypothetical protein